jgi:plasmid stabilization system protein ParE
MARYRVSRKAVRDLDEIWYFIAKDNETPASRQIDYPYSRPSPRNPSWGARGLKIATDMRSFSVGEQVVFYQIGDPGVRIVRVWDGRQDPARIGTR